MASGKRIGYAVVGLGSISQVAVLPAFAHSKKAKLIAVVSGDKEKARKYATEFKASDAYSYSEFAECLKNPAVGREFPLRSEFLTCSDWPHSTAGRSRSGK